MADTQRLRLTSQARSATRDASGDLLTRITIVVLALATGAIHLSLGGLLFTLNGIGYGVAAVAMVAPLALAVRFRWLVRLGLIGYALTAIVGWILVGPRYPTAYLAKAIEIALISLLAFDFARQDGNPVKVIRGAVTELADAVRHARRASTNR